MMAKDALWLFERYNMFPVLESQRNTPQTYIPYNIIAPHEAQAIKNHRQSLQRLAERGGLGWTEILAVLMDKTWKEMGWSDLITIKEAETREKEAEEAVRAYVQERSGNGNG